MSTYSARDARQLSVPDVLGAITFGMALIVVVFWQSSAALLWHDEVLRTFGYLVPWVALILTALFTILLTHVKRPATWLPILAIILLSVFHAILGAV
ncbi:hypothetical protein QT381_04575 [Galbitalea sp. SE-J8]|uniref:hypothetical protein n=1 Tax=Galbitalea sp. SE-J8 TaxID=3054952 RepID=UPI00259CD7B1|nr:hypothetical protein [Galbitalea sp. SE-J8]MDM4762279.1 hypothetical protein [Galbitalea sp. SE-J8]